MNLLLFSEAFTFDIHFIRNQIHFDCICRMTEQQQQQKNNSTEKCSNELCLQGQKEVYIFFPTFLYFRMPRKKRDMDIRNNARMVQWTKRQKEKKSQVANNFRVLFSHPQNKAPSSIIISWIPSKCSVTSYLCLIYFFIEVSLPSPKGIVQVAHRPCCEKIFLFTHGIAVKPLVSMSWIT